jgi:hypothetical protein
MTNEPINQIQVLMEGLDENNLVSILDKWKEITEVRKQLDEWENALREKVKTHLKERRWTEYLCPENNINITLRMEKREVMDTKLLKTILNPIQLSQVTRITTFERLTITTPEMRKNMTKFFKKKER